MILVAVGANLPGPDGQPPIETCRAAIVALRLLPGLCVTSVSNWWETAPIPPSGQPPYINGVVGLSGNIEPDTLLMELQKIEERFGRERHLVNAARTLDLDIIAMANVVRRAPDPILPHPRAHLRAFVLYPLLEIAPNWVHPETNQTGTSLLEKLSDQFCTRI